MESYSDCLFRNKKKDEEKQTKEKHLCVAYWRSLCGALWDPVLLLGSYPPGRYQDYSWYLSALLRAHTKRLMVVRVDVPSWVSWTTCAGWMGCRYRLLPQGHRDWCWTISMWRSSRCCFFSSPVVSLICTNAAEMDSQSFLLLLNWTDWCPFCVILWQSLGVPLVFFVHCRRWRRTPPSSPSSRVRCFS